VRMDRCSKMTLRHLIGILVFIGVLSFPSLAQPYIVQGSIEHSGQGKIYLASYYGDSFRKIDSLESTSGSFLFLLSEEDQTGVYRLIYSDEYKGVRSENRFVEFIYNQNDVLLNVSVDEKGPIPNFENSIENQVYLEFMTFQLEYEEKLSEVYSQLIPAIPGNERYEAALKRYEELQLGRKSFIDSLNYLWRWPPLPPPGNSLPRTIALIRESSPCSVHRCLPRTSPGYRDRVIGKVCGSHPGYPGP